MNINTRVTPRAQQAPTASSAQASEKTFNYNAQDPATAQNDTTTLSVSGAETGRPESPDVMLRNKKAIFFFGQLVALRDDPSYKLPANPDGNFVYPQEHANYTGANAFSAAAKTVEKYNEVYGELTGKKIEWAFGNEKLTVSPGAPSLTHQRYLPLDW